MNSPVSQQSAFEQWSGLLATVSRMNQVTLKVTTAEGLLHEYGYEVLAERELPPLTEADAPIAAAAMRRMIQFVEATTLLEQEVPVQSPVSGTLARHLMESFLDGWPDNAVDIAAATSFVDESISRWGDPEAGVLVDDVIAAAPRTYAAYHQAYDATFACIALGDPIAGSVLHVMDRGMEWIAEDVNGEGLPILKEEHVPALLAGLEYIANMTIPLAEREGRPFYQSGAFAETLLETLLGGEGIASVEQLDAVARTHPEPLMRALMEGMAGDGRRLDVILQERNLARHLEILAQATHDAPEAVRETMQYAVGWADETPCHRPARVHEASESTLANAYRHVAALAESMGAQGVDELAMNDLIHDLTVRAVARAGVSSVPDINAHLARLLIADEPLAQAVIAGARDSALSTDGQGYAAMTVADADKRPALLP